MMSSTQSQSQFPKLIALDVAAAFLEEGPGRLPDETQLVEVSALLVGEHLAESGHAGDWSRLDVQRLFEQVTHLDEHERTGLALTVVAFYGWLGNIGLVCTDACRRVLGDIIRFGPNVGYLHTLAVSGQRMLSRLELGYADTLH